MTGRATLPHQRAAQLVPVGTAFRTLLRGILVAKSLQEHIEDWQSLSRGSRAVSLDVLHEARRLAEKLGLHDEERVLSMAIGVLDALATGDETTPVPRRG